MAKFESTKLVKPADSAAPVSYKTTPPKGGTAVQKSLGEKLFKVVSKLGKQKKDYPGHLKHPLPSHYDTSPELHKKVKKPKVGASLKDRGMEIHQQEQLARSKKAVRASKLMRKGMMADLEAGEDDDGMVY